MVVAEEPTGTCAVLVTADGERSLIANLAAANHFKAKRQRHGGKGEDWGAAWRFFFSPYEMGHSSLVLSRLCSG
jgi:sugar/nucleoside kinase (ribokinase family)